MSCLISKILSVLTPRPIIWIFIAGRRHSLRKYDVSEHVKERKPPYVQKFIHEMMWGKTLRNLVKRGVQIAEEALSRFPDALGLQSAGLTSAPLAADYMEFSPSSTNFSNMLSRSGMNSQAALASEPTRISHGLYSSRIRGRIRSQRSLALRQFG